MVDQAAAMNVSPGYRRLVLTLLVIAYVFNFIDRQLMTILLEPIKAEFDASDTAMGFMTGFAFAIFYATLGVPVARLADRWSHRNVLALALVIWSGMTALCGMAANYWQLLLFRIGVGVGEAGGTAPSHALIAAYYPPKERSTAMGIYGSSTQIGVLIGMFGGAVIAEQLGWRWAFVIFGLPGVLFGAVVYFAIREPLRSVQAIADRTTFREDIGKLLNTPGFVLIGLALGFTALAGYGMGAWFPSFLIRVHGLTLTEAGLILGLVGTFGAIIGAVGGGVLVDRLTPSDERWQLWVPAAGAAASVLFMGLFLIWPESAYIKLGGFKVPAATAFLFLGAIVSSFWVGPTYAAIQTLTAERLRAQASAMIMLMLNLIGLGLGPLVVGILSDVLTPELGEQAIRYAMLVSLSSVLIGTAAYWRAGIAYRALIESRSKA